MLLPKYLRPARQTIQDHQTVLDPGVESKLVDPA